MGFIVAVKTNTEIVLTIFFKMKIRNWEQGVSVTIYATLQQNQKVINITL